MSTLPKSYHVWVQPDGSAITQAKLLDLVGFNKKVLKFGKTGGSSAAKTIQITAAVTLTEGIELG